KNRDVRCRDGSPAWGFGEVALLLRASRAPAPSSGALAPLAFCGPFFSVGIAKPLWRYADTRSRPANMRPMEIAASLAISQYFRVNTLVGSPFDSAKKPSNSI